jgi:hypothetical protein
MNNYNRWAIVYCDYSNKEKPHYLRFSPNFMSFGFSGYPHGLSLHTCRFKTKEEAISFSYEFEEYMDSSMKDYEEDKREHQKEGIEFVICNEWATPFAYVDSKTNQLVYSVSLSHPYRNIEKEDFHQGFPIGGNVFNNKEDAEKFSSVINQLMANMMSEYEQYKKEKLTKQYRWVSRYFDFNNKEKPCVVNITPNFMDMNHTHFPHGIPIGGITFKDEVDSIMFMENLEKFMDDFIDAYEEELYETLEKGEKFTTETQWTKVYAAPDDEMTCMEHHVRLLPPYGCLEDSGQPHGLLIGNVSFKTVEEADKFAIVINQFMNQMMIDYEEDKQDQYDPLTAM